ncbi:MAG: BrnT family toxin [Candidatus Blackburnbacteria bacterium]|nr:BrnT family toxin [Candidatus Blackburnbacteria bacterium]
MVNKKLKEVIAFAWDKGNIDKNFIKHEVTNEEAEEVFFDKKKVTFPDVLHSSAEERFRVVGKTEKGRILFVVFTKRGDKIRVISARDINKKEISLYEKET